MKTFPFAIQSSLNSSFSFNVHASKNIGLNGWSLFHVNKSARSCKRVGCSNVTCELILELWVVRVWECEWFFSFYVALRWTSDWLTVSPCLCLLTSRDGLQQTQATLSAGGSACRRWIDGLWLSVQNLGPARSVCCICVCKRGKEDEKRPWDFKLGKEPLWRQFFLCHCGRRLCWWCELHSSHCHHVLQCFFQTKGIIFLRRWGFLREPKWPPVLCHWYKIPWLASSFTLSSLTEALSVVRSERDRAGQLSDDVGVAH